MAKDGAWTFDGETLRLVPGRRRGVHRLRRELGEIAVPLRAVAGVTFEPGRRGGRLRLRLRDGADPFTQAVGGWLSEQADPYQLGVEGGRTGAAEYFVDEVRNALLLDQVPDGPCDRYLLPGPPVPLVAAALDGSVAFDGAEVRLEWKWLAEERKSSAGARRIALADLVGVEWHPAVGLTFGFLRFRCADGDAGLSPEDDPNCLVLFGTQEEVGKTAMVAAAVTARLPHPSAAGARDAVPDPAAERGAVAAAETVGADTAGAPGAGEDHDALLRRLWELAQLHERGVLTYDEFTAAKQAVLRRF
ncbi:DUF4429 domain-containing protein [Streptomyces capparidis]